jgi:hypothetical protein
MGNSEFSSIDHTPDSAPQGWFKNQVYNGENATLRGYFYTELAALKAFHDREIGPDEAAHAITRPVSESPVPFLDTYSDEIVVLCRLWELYTHALDEWPLSRTKDLINLGLAISKLRDELHRGEARDENEQPLIWKDLPYFHMVWSDAHWAFPWNILKKKMDNNTRREIRDTYIKQQIVEAQLIAAGILGWNRAFRIFGHALDPEEESRMADCQQKGRECRNGEELAKKGSVKDEEEIGPEDIDIAAESYWIDYVGEWLFQSLMHDKTWEKRCGSRFVVISESETPSDSHRPCSGWDALLARYYTAATDGPNTYTQERARVMIEKMEKIKEKALRSM